jgi:Zn-dependent protease with chaperone function
MDFFQAQADAERRTSLLVVLFAGAVLAIILTVYATVHVVAGPGLGAPIDPALFAGVAAGVLFLVGTGSAVRTLQLRRGGPAVAELLGGTRLSPQTTDPDERRLINVVEEMAIASGVPVPAIYVLEGEVGINAFAAGHTVHDAAVAVTRGTLERLSRDELQGVIAHEFSHILNGDMRLNLRIMGLLFGILLLAVVGRGMLRLGSSGSKGSSRKKGGGGGQLALIGLALVLVGYIGVFFGRMIQAAISRQREFLADAAAVQFTRNPAGIAGALKVIGAYEGGSKVDNPHAEEAGHLFFATRARASFAGLMATHPPLTERIRRIDPSFDGRFEKIPLRPLQRPAAERAPGDEPAPQASALPEGVLAPLQFLASIGMPSADHLLRAANMLGAMPDALREAARSPDDVPALLFALLYDPADAGAATAAATIRRYGGEAMLARTEALAVHVRAGGPMGRFPLLGLALPTVQMLPPERIDALLPTVDALIHADGQVDAFEHVLSQHLERQLGAKPARPSRSTVHSLAPLRAPLEVVLSALAHTGADDDRAAQAALAAATRTLPAELGALTLRDQASTTPAAVRQALEQLAAGSPEVRRRILECAAHVVSADGAIRYPEAELLRAVAAALDCPVPPMLDAPAPAPGHTG